MREADQTSKPAATAPRQRAAGRDETLVPQRTEDEAARPAATRPSRSRVSRDRAAAAIFVIRVRLAAVIWLIALTAAIVLSLGAMLVALQANLSNSLVEGVLAVARAVDGPFWKVFDFYRETPSGRQGPPDVVKNHLVNWGLATAAYLLVGRLISNLIRPTAMRSAR